MVVLLLRGLTAEWGQLEHLVPTSTLGHHPNQIDLNIDHNLRKGSGKAPSFWQSYAHIPCDKNFGEMRRLMPTDQGRALICM